MNKSLRVELTGKQRLMYYLPVFQVTALAVLFIFAGYPLAWLLLAIAPVVFLIQHGQLGFTEVFVALDEAEFRSLVTQVAAKQQWRIVSINGDKVVATTRFSLWSWGEQITILRDDRRVLFNSIPDPRKAGSVVLSVKHASNLRKFSRAAESVSRKQETALIFA